MYKQYGFTFRKSCEISEGGNISKRSDMYLRMSCAYEYNENNNGIGNAKRNNLICRRITIN